MYRIDTYNTLLFDIMPKPKVPKITGFFMQKNILKNIYNKKNFTNRMFFKDDTRLQLWFISPQKFHSKVCSH